MQNIKKILITGGAGYIGSVLTSKLISLEYDVVILDNLYYTDIGIKSFLKSPFLTVINADICKKSAIKQSLINVDCIIHLAAISNDLSGALDPRITHQINYEIYPILLEEAKKQGVQRFINASSCGVYGIKNSLNITEEEPLNPQKEYSIYKAKSEKIVNDFNSNDFSTINLRCATVCGWSPRMRFDVIVNLLIAHAIIDKTIKVWGGEQKRPQIHIEDLTDYFIKIIKMPSNIFSGKTYNAGGQNITIKEIATLVKATIGGKINLEYLPPRDDERTYHVSSDKIFNELGLKPTRGVEQAIKDIQEAYNLKLWKNYNNPLYNNVKRIKEIGFGYSK